MFCCVCNGTCNHTGEHSYCDKHRVYPGVKDPTPYPVWLLPSMPSAPGWVCPACGAGNAPWVSRCSCKGWPKYEVTCTTKTQGGLDQNA